MNQIPDKVPDEDDWVSLSNVFIDTYYEQKFFGKTRSEMLAYFIDNPLSASEALSYMPAAPFQYYVFAFKDAFETDAYFKNGEPNLEAPSAVSTFLRLLRSKLTETPQDILPVLELLMPIAEYVSANQEKFDADLDIFDSFPEIFKEITVLFEWTKRWHPVILPQSPPALPRDCELVLLNLGFPQVVEIRCYNDITLEFSGKLTKLSDIWQRDTDTGLKLGTMPKDWNRFWHVADQKYLQGGGWICIEEKTGKLFVIDLDLSEPVFLLCSSVQNLYRLLLHANLWTENTDGNSNAIKKLRRELLSLTNFSSKELGPFWINIIDATLDQESPHLAFTVREGKNERLST
ncbi:MAG: hypothetical protein SFY67_14030 [Candidatus Melainabacteria bacterium]|nr:hypothetical protein [Candidatus Melainabacteria bacterium]